MRVKVCGITSLNDALMAIEAGAYALGFNFYQSSPRYIDPSFAAGIIRLLPNHIVTVGIFVNAPIDQVIAVTETSGTKIVQLHGNEAPEMGEKIPYPIIKAIREQRDIHHSSNLYALLIDAKVEGQFGGTGICADWLLARALAKQFPLILAGGINAENVITAIQMVRPVAVDLCSGVEAYPGVKSREKLIRFFDEVRYE